MKRDRLEIQVDEELTLREFSLTDAKAFYDLIDRNREHLSQNGDETATKYPDLSSFARSISNPSDPHKLRMGIWASNVPVGSVNLKPGKKNDAEIGYWLGKEFEGHGYVSRAVTGLVGYAFRDLGIRKVVASVHPDNTRSKNLLTKLGFHKESSDKPDSLHFYKTEGE